MYERMLDKHNQPSIDEFQQHCGQVKNLFDELDVFLLNILGTKRLLRFPYGNNYGWGMKYYIKNKHICDIFAEKDAFNVMLRLTDKQFETVYDTICDYTKECIDKKYPCTDGGWIHFRVLTQQHLMDIEKLLTLKIQK